jgi:hypothetical protein
MRKLYENRPILFAVIWIVAYSIVGANVRGSYGDDSLALLLVMVAFAVGSFAFVKANRLESYYGLDRWAQNAGRYLHFIPMWVLATANLWDGFSPSYHGAALVYATLTMLLVGFVEEMLFRGFLFKAMLEDGSTTAAIVVTSLTFGAGHIVNLLAGQAGFETMVQMVFAISWGFMLTLVYYRGGSLLPCIIAHSMIDVFSVYSTDSAVGDWVAVVVTIAGAIAYCAYLARQKSA